MLVQAKDIPADQVAEVRVFLDKELQQMVCAFDQEEGWVECVCSYPREQVEAYPDRFFVFQAARFDDNDAIEDGQGSDADGNDIKYVSNIDPAGFASMDSESAGVDLTKLAAEHPEIIIVAANLDGTTFFAIDHLGRRLVNRKAGVVSVEGLPG